MMKTMSNQGSYKEPSAKEYRETLRIVGDRQRRLVHKELRGLSDIGRDAEAPFLEAWQAIDLERRREIARAMFDQLEMPWLRLDMNPRKGMVAVPTWFWVEGYDGGTLTLSDSISATRKQCHTTVNRDARGDAVLGADGAPSTREDCRPITDTLSVEVLVWPTAYDWDFGDRKAQHVGCMGIGMCPAGIGRAFTDPLTPSPIAHAYRWSSLDQNGLADAYTIRLGITFGAQYRFSLNGASPSGWQPLGARELNWAEPHQVQEAQAVLTRP